YGRHADHVRCCSRLDRLRDHDRMRNLPPRMAQAPACSASGVADGQANVAAPLNVNIPPGKIGACRLLRNALSIRNDGGPLDTVPELRRLLRLFGRLAALFA